jgi:hypothetical protein
MILLSGHSLTPDRRVPIEKHSLRLRERESEADITPADMGGIGTESWLLDDVEPGAGIVWRVASIRQEFATATPTVHLEHMIMTHNKVSYLRKHFLCLIIPAVYRINADSLENDTVLLIYQMLHITHQFINFPCR